MVINRLEITFTILKTLYVIDIQLFTNVKNS